MKKLISSICFSSLIIASSAYADITMSVAPSVSKPVTFNLAVGAKDLPTTKLDPVTVKPGQQASVNIRSQYGSQLMQYRGNNPFVIVSVGKKHLQLAGSPSSDHTVSYNGSKLSEQ